MSDKYKIRQMNIKEVADIAIKWAEKEGWNPGITDAKPFYAADPKGFFIGEIDGKPASCISIVRYDDKFCFLGFYIVAPEYRGRGLGLKIFKRAMECAEKRNIGGDGVLSRIEDYKKLGFKPAYKNRRYEGRGRGTGVRSPQLKEITSIDLRQLFAYDDSVFPAKRHDFLKYWIGQAGTKGYIYTTGGNIAGYGVIRPCFKGYKIGPLFADDAAIAENIFDALLGSVNKGEEVFFDVPEPNQASLKLAEKNGMKIVFETIRIYLPEAPAVPIEKVFGITSFELG